MQTTKHTFPKFADRCETTYNGIDAQEFAREKDCAALRQRNIKRTSYRGHVLIDAFVQVVRQYPDVVLDIVGPLGTRPVEGNFDLHDDRITKLSASRS
jgi:hypothetical protein